MSRVTLIGAGIALAAVVSKMDAGLEHFHELRDFGWSLVSSFYVSHTR